METSASHPVDQLSDDELYALLMRVDARGFPGDLDQLWRIERVRYRQTLRRIPAAHGPEAGLLDLGSSRPWLPFFQELLGYRRIVLNTAYPDSGMVTTNLAGHGPSADDVKVSVFDLEHDGFPFDDETFDTVCCLEVLEHLAVDPMAMMAEVNRVLKPGGEFVLTTPNAIRYSNAVNMVLGEHPLGWTPYNGYDTNRHNREYTPAEIGRLFHAAGLTPTELSTFGAKRRGFKREFLKLVLTAALLPNVKCPLAWRHDVILAFGRKTSTRIERRPAWLYFDPAEYEHRLNRGRVAKAKANPACAAEAKANPECAEDGVPALT